MNSCFSNVVTKLLLWRLLFTNRKFSILFQTQLSWVSLARIGSKCSRERPLAPDNGLHNISVLTPHCIVHHTTSSVRKPSISLEYCIKAQISMLFQVAKGSYSLPMRVGINYITYIVCVVLLLSRGPNRLGEALACSKGIHKTLVTSPICIQNVSVNYDAVFLRLNPPF